MDRSLYSWLHRIFSAVNVLPKKLLRFSAIIPLCLLCLSFPATAFARLWSLSEQIEGPDQWRSVLKQAYSDPGSAVAATKRLLSGFPDFGPAYCLLAGLYERSNDFEATVNTYRDGIVHAPDFTPLYSELGWFYRRIREYRLAEEVLKMGLVVNAESEDLHYGLAVVYNETGQVVLAEQEYRYCIKLSPKLESSLRIFPKKLSCSIQLACEYMQRREYARSFELLRTTRMYFSEDPQVYLWLAIYYKELNQPGLACVLFKKALFKASGYPDFPLYALCVEYGKVLLSLKRFDEAIPVFKIGTVVKPDEPWFFKKLGECYFAMQMYAEAVAAYERYLEIPPPKDRVDPVPGALYYDMSCMYLKLARYDKAARAAREALAKAPHMVLAYYNLVEAYRKLGDHAKAAAAAGEAAAIDPCFRRNMVVRSVWFGVMMKIIHAIVAAVSVVLAVFVLVFFEKKRCAKDKCDLNAMYIGFTIAKLAVAAVLIVFGALAVARGFMTGLF